MTATAARRPARINPDRLPVLIVAVALTAGLAVVSFALSFAGLVGVSSWAHVPTNLIWAVPVMLDAAILVYTLAILVKRERRESAAGTWVILTLWTGVSVAANAAHAYDVAPEWQRLIGTVIAALAPVALLLATHTIADLIVAPVADADTATDTDADTTTAVRTDTSAASAPDEADTSADTDTVRAIVTDTTDTEADTAPDADADTTTDSSADTANADDQDTPRPTASAPVADTRTPARTTVRRHPAPSGPRRRAADHREDILTLAAEGLSVRAIADQVGLGKTAVARLLRSDTITA